MRSALIYFFAALVISFSFLSFSANAYALATTPCPTPTTGTPAPLQPCNYTSNQNADNLGAGIKHWLDCEVFASDAEHPNDPIFSCLTYTGNGSSTSGTYVVYNSIPGGGALGKLSNVMVAMYAQPPLSSRQYLADIGANLGVVTPAYAQVSGAGSGVLSPILKVWQVSRNIAYLAFILIFLAVGFMIMLRQKINAQTVVSVQNALPGLVIGLVLVTFSYLIAALIVDLAFIGSAVVANLVTSSGIYNSSTVFDPVKDNILTILKNLVFNTDNFGTIITPLQNTFSSFIPDKAVGGPLGGVLGAVLGGLATLVLGFAIIIQVFRLIFELVKAYISILVITVLGPFIILGSSLPGRGESLGLWWRSLLANSVVFPVVIGAFLFAGIFLHAGNPTEPTSAMPLFGGLDPNILRVALGYGIILITPGIPKAVKDALKAPDHPIGGHAFSGAAAGFEFGGAFGGIVGRRAVNRAYGVANARVQAAAATGQTAPGWARAVRRGVNTLWSGTATNAQGHRVHGWRDEGHIHTGNPLRPY